MERIWLALGSNLAKPLNQVDTAIKVLSILPKTRLIACSSYYRSRPLGPQNQPDFLNAVAVLDTELNPLELLNHTKTIELQQGRTRKGYRFGPRTLDLDILLFGQLIFTTPWLTIPHYAMREREFVLYPLAELAPNLRFPDGEALANILQYIPYNGMKFWDDTHRLRYF